MKLEGDSLLLENNIRPILLKEIWGTNLQRYPKLELIKIMFFF